MTLQTDRAGGAPAAQTNAQTRGGDELPAGGLCAEDCHFCWGPETD
ncbi:hypothetical protein [Arthrobacter sp. SO5]|nr:hypothetical protein [Arthrobacter sp. SO5]